MLACDFFTIETVFLKTIYVLSFIELNTRRVYVPGCTSQPNSVWITQQGRQFLWQLQDEQRTMRFLIHDRDTKFSASFETAFVAEGIETILTPYRAPNANAVAERWVCSVRHECLDRLLILNERHLRRVLKEYTDYNNTARIKGYTSRHRFPSSQDLSMALFTVATYWVVSSTIIGGKRPSSRLSAAEDGFSYTAGRRLFERVRWHLLALTQPTGLWTFRLETASAFPAFRHFS